MAQIFISLEQAVVRQPPVMSAETLVEKAIASMSKRSTSCVLACALVEKETSASNSVIGLDRNCVLVTDDSQLVGILTEQMLVDLISSGQSLKGTTLTEVMRSDVISLTFTGTEDVFTALNLFRRYQIRHLPVIDRDNRLLGLITPGSLRRALRSTDLLKFRTVKEVMSRAIHAESTTSVLKVAQLMSNYQVSSIPIVETAGDNELLYPVGMITEKDIVQFQLLELNLAEVTAGAVMSTPLHIAKPDDSLREVHQQMNQCLVRRLVVVGDRGEMLGIVTQNSLLRAIDLSDLNGSWEILQNSARKSAPERINALKKLNLNLIDRVELQASELQERERREQLVAQTALRIRHSLELELILKTTVAEIRELIEADRVLIYRLDANGTGIVNAEAVSHPQWSIIDRVVRDSCFESAWLEPYQQGHIFAVADIDRANLSPCHLEFLKSFQVKANVAIPILLTAPDSGADRLWGLLIVHQCSAPRNWQEPELELLGLLTVQVAIAIQQGELYQQTQIELQQRQEAEIALRESESRFRNLANTAPVLIWISDTNKLCTFLNQTWLEYTGQTIEEELGDGWTQRLHPADRKRCWNTYSCAFDKREEFTIEYRLQRANGEYGWILDRGVPRFDSNGQFAGYIGSCIDISDRKQAEADLKQGEAQLRTALNAAAMGTWSLEIATGKLTLSERTEIILDLNPGDTYTLDTILERVHPEDRATVQQQAAKTIKDGELYQIETRTITLDGKHRWITARGHVLLDSEDRPQQMVGIIADVTEKKSLEKQFLRHQRLESLGSLAGGVAHDLNNILTPILMSVQLLPLTLSQINPRSQELIEMLENNVKRGSALVQQVLSFAKGVEGKPGIVQIKHLIRDIKQIVIETFPKTIEIKTNIASNLWTVIGDATQIHQILLNLVINARDAMPNGGLLDISAINLSIDEEYVRQHPQAQVGSYVAISISDTGIGIAPDNLKQIFDPFFTTKENEGGTGLGLATTMNIVQSHGGFIDVVSQIEEGTQFNVFMPAAKIADSQQIESMNIPEGEGELILVADDEATIREITKASLETHNYRVVTASDGIEAIAKYVKEQDDIALVLMNMTMPAMDGTTAIRTLQKINPEVKIIAISGHNLNSQTFSDRNLNIRSFLTKPYTTQALLQTIKDVVAS
jgi:PAS domain S-box-containing protein